MLGANVAVSIREADISTSGITGIDDGRYRRILMSAFLSTLGSRGGCLIYYAGAFHLASWFQASHHLDGLNILGLGVLQVPSLLRTHVG
jgi:hypothetical protein